MSFETCNNNKVYLCGKIISEPIFSHEIYGEKFYDINLEVQRLSNQCDIIPVTISERLFNENCLEQNKIIALKGQFRSYNKLVGGKSKLMLTVFARELCEEIPALSGNIIEIVGYVCKDPIFRTTPFKREICDVLLAVNRAYNKSDYLPCIAWGRNARFVSELGIGQKVFVTGRIQSRQYQKRIDDEKTETRTAFEISIAQISTEDNVEKLLDNCFEEKNIITQVI